MRRRSYGPLTAILAWLVASPVLLASPGVAQTGGGANNVVQVVSTADGSFSARSNVQAAPFGGDSAQSTNLARAEARDCTGCRSQAAALQAVFLTGDPSTVTVTNAAVATNSGCTGCSAYAYAFQYVVSPNRPVALSPEGRQAIVELNRRATAIIAQQTDPDALTEQLRGLFGELKQVVDGELRAAGVDAVTRSREDRQTASA
jgi:hypothetical protein